MMIKPFRIQPKTTLSNSKLNYFIYKVEGNNINCKGIIACISMEEYKSGSVLVHENIFRETLSAIKADLLETQHQKFPIILAYKPQAVVNQILDELSSGQPCATMLIDGVTHSVWNICENQLIKRLENIYKKIEYCWVADGHHRLRAFNELNTTPLSQKKFNQITAWVVDETQLTLNCYHRALINRLPMSVDEFIHSSSRYCSIKKIDKVELPIGLTEFCFCTDNSCYKMQVKGEYLEENSSVAFFIEKIFFNSFFSWSRGKKERNVLYIPGDADINTLKCNIYSNKLHDVFLLPKPSLQDIEKLFHSPPHKLAAHFSYIQPKPMQIEYAFEELRVPCNTYASKT